MRCILLAAALILAVPPALAEPSSGPLDLAHCQGVFMWEVCVSVEDGSVCFRYWSGMPPAIEGCLP